MPRRSSAARREAWAAWLLAAPAVLACIASVWLPAAANVALSVVDWNVLTGHASWRGIDHYAYVLLDPDARATVGNTMLYLAALVPLQVVAPLVMAFAVLRVRPRGASNAYRAMLFLPSVLSFPVAAVAWLWMFNPVVGVLNAVLAGIGQPPQGWLNDPHLALWSVVVVAFWKSFGLNLLIFVAALVNVPAELREAAALDGAGAWRTALRIELPVIGPTLFFAVVTTLLLVLDELVGAVDVLTEGGPFGSSRNLPYLMYERAFRHFQFGEGAAIATVITGVVGLATWAQFRVAGRRVHYG